MLLSPKLLAGGLAGLGLLLSAGAALADPAQATAAVNVRSGPGTGYGVVDTLYPGESVDVGNCQGGWCYIQHNGPAGWVSANYLDEGGGSYTPPPVYDDGYDDGGPYYDEPAPIYITPPPIYVNPPHYPYPHHRWTPPNGKPGHWTPPNGSNPPPNGGKPWHKPPPNSGNPPVIPPTTGQHPHNGFPFPGGNNSQPHFNNPSGAPAFHQPRIGGGQGGANICQTDPAVCQPGGQGQHRQH